MAEWLKETLSAAPEKACHPVLLLASHGQTGRRSTIDWFLSQSRHRGLIRSSDDSQLRNR
jgi:hypothetical protein